MKLLKNKIMKTALILVDIQNDFLPPHGTLAVKNGDQILPIVNELVEYPFDFIIATKDWHPSDHGSFATQHHKKPGERIILNGLEQILWPVHCVQETIGAEFSPDWKSHKVQHIFYKGIDKNIDSYSTFYDNGHRRSTGLELFLKKNHVSDLYFAGLATDYCVKYSVLDAAKLGFNIYVIVDACKAVNLCEGDEEKAIEEMRQIGAKMITSKDLVKS